jgi:hypothetical protein
VIKFISDLRQVGGFVWVLRFPPQIKLTATITEILLKVALNTINQTTLILWAEKQQTFFKAFPRGDFITIFNDIFYFISFFDLNIIFFW